MMVPNGFFSVDVAPVTGWFHLAVVYLGPNDGQGLIVYVNRTKVKKCAQRSNRGTSPGNGQLVIGNKLIGSDDYSSVAVDELTLWNRELSDQEIEDLYQMFP